MASTFFSSISTLALAAASGGSNLSSSETSSIFCPWTPPLALMLSIHSFAPSVVSFTPAATGPLKPAVWPIRSWEQAHTGASAAHAATTNFFIRTSPTTLVPKTSGTVEMTPERSYRGEPVSPPN